MRKIIILITIIAASTMIIISCTDKNPAPTNNFATDESSCTSCHLNADLLKEVAEPLPVDPGGNSGET